MIEALPSIVQGIANAHDLNTAMELLVVKLKQAMGVGVCSIYLDDPAEDRYLLMASDGLNRGSVRRSYLSYGEGLVGLTAERAEVVNTDDAPGHPNYRFLNETGEQRYNSFLGVPIVHRGQVLGVLVVQESSKRVFDDAEVSLLVTLSAQMASVISHTTRVSSQGAFGWQTLTQDLRFEGIVATAGVGLGTGWVVETKELAAIPDTRSEDPALEEKRFKAALQTLKQSLETTAERLSDLRIEERALFTAYQRMLDDDSLAGEILARIRKGHGAAGAIARVTVSLGRRFDQMDDAYLRERGADVRDLGQRLIAAVNEQDSAPVEWPKHVVLIADELTPAVLGDIPREKLAGLLAMKGSASSHVAILARSMNVPCVVGLADLPIARIHGLDVVVDGYRGLTVINPTRGTSLSYRLIKREDDQTANALKRLVETPAVTPDGLHVPLLINLGGGVESLNDLAKVSEGCGLSRTEIPFMLESSFPTEAAQTEAYRSELAAFAPKPVTMRTLDIGGDKSLPYFHIQEANPFLGWRGIRVSLDHPELFLAQVRAMIRASEGLDNLRILLPMISGLEEVDASVALIHRAWNELVVEGFDVNLPKLGVMIEVPSAIYLVPEIARRVDFMSVGSNDLTQYLLAVDRDNPQVAGLYDSFHPAVIRALWAVAAGAKGAQAEVSMCGEMAGEPLAVPLLMAMGYDSLSMNLGQLQRCKAVINAVTVKDAKTWLSAVMDMESGEAIREFMKARLAERDLEALFAPRMLARLDND